MPPAAADAMAMLQLCERFHCLPSAIYEEDTGLLRLIEIEKLVLAADPDYRDRESAPEGRAGGEPP
jgi:hypothetical protein